MEEACSPVTVSLLIISVLWEMRGLYSYLIFSIISFLLFLCLLMALLSFKWKRLWTSWCQRRANMQPLGRWTFSVEWPHICVLHCKTVCQERAPCMLLAQLPAANRKLPSADCVRELSDHVTADLHQGVKGSAREPNSKKGCAKYKMVSVLVSVKKM